MNQQSPYSQDDIQALLPFCTATQRRHALAVLEHGSARKASLALGLHKDAVADSLRAAKAAAARMGVAPEHDMTRSVPDGFYVRGVSTLYDGDGLLRAQWVKSNVDQARQAELLVAAIEASCADLPRTPRMPAPRKASKHLLAVYPMGDPHIGMHAWGQETGDDFDLDIAERNLIAAMQRLVRSVPPCEQALIVNLGDFFHADNSSSRTTRSGNVLDVDTRWAKVLRIGIRAMRACIEAALQHHKQVRVINEIGNHDDHTAHLLTIALSSLYERNPRVTFDHSPAKFHYHTFFKNLIGVTHGDTVKPEQLGGIMATDRPEEWGATKFRYWLTGHIHHRKVYELPGCVVESFRTLAGKDAWTASMGYRAGRDMIALCLHRDFGEIERHTVSVAMLEGGK